MIKGVLTALFLAPCLLVGLAIETWWFRRPGTRDRTVVALILVAAALLLLAALVMSGKANAREFRAPAPPPAAAALSLACSEPDSAECHAAAITVLSRYASRLPTTWKSESVMPRRWWWNMHRRPCRCMCRR